MTTNGDFGNSGQSEESDNGPNGFPMSQNLGIDTKIKSLGLSKQKLRIWPRGATFKTAPKWVLQGKSGHGQKI